MALNGWIEIGMSNPNIFASQGNTDMVVRSFDETYSNKIIIGNTSSNEGPNRLGGIYIMNNNVGFKKVPLSNVDVDINGLYSTIDGRVASNLTIGYGNNAGFLQLRGDMLILNSNTSDMRAINSNNTFKFMYSNVERIKFTNGAGMYLNDNVFITNDVYATGFFMTSDSNFKENITKTCYEDDFDKLMKLKVYDFNFKGTERTTKGFIAQQIEEVVPSAIKEVDSVLPSFTGYLSFTDLHLVLNKQGIDMKMHFSKDDIIVLGHTDASKDFLVKIDDVTTNMIKLISNQTTSNLITTGVSKLYVFGKMGKMKTIDTNQILALCVSSIQRLSKQMNP